MKLHEKQIQLIELLKKNHSNPMSIREIQEELGISSVSLVHHHIKQLEKKGYLKRNPSNPRDYQILTDPEKPISYLNLYGLAKCGKDGTILSGNPIDRVPIYSKLIPFSAEDAFLVEATGNSMEPKIHEGDLIIGKKQNTADNGDIIICTLELKAMIKKYSYNENNQDIILESFNTNVFPIFVQKKKFKIEGVMKGIICSHGDLF